ncbi:MAG: peptidase T, partial [Atopobiaceae bacterium]|nr:peptidase T [Atopobiaceae bacterium]
MSDVLERFLRYVQVGSPSNPNNDSVVPSTECQHDMARLLEAELIELGLSDAHADEHAYVTATVPASAGCEHLPALGLLAHIDTSSDAPGFDVKPHIVHYEGGNLVSGVVNGKVIETTPEDAPILNKLV